MASGTATPQGCSALVPAQRTYPTYAGAVAAPMMYSGASVRVAAPVATVAGRPTTVVTRMAAPINGASTPMMAAPMMSTMSVVPSNAAQAAGLPPLPSSGPPLKLTEGIPDLASVAAQREEYLRALDQQEGEAMRALEEQKLNQVKAIRARGDQKKSAYSLEVEQQVRRHDLALSQQHGQHMMMLNQQYSTQRGVLEHQANSLVMEFQHKKAHEDMLMQQYQLQRAMHDSQKQYETEMGVIKEQASPIAIPGMHVAQTSYQPPPTVIATHSYQPPMVVQQPQVTANGYRSLSYVPAVLPAAMSAAMPARVIQAQ